MVLKSQLAIMQAYVAGGVAGADPDDMLSTGIKVAQEQNWVLSKEIDVANNRNMYLSTRIQQLEADHLRLENEHRGERGELNLLRENLQEETKRAETTLAKLAQLQLVHDNVLDDNKLMKCSIEQADVLNVSLRVQLHLAQEEVQELRAKSGSLEQAQHELVLKCSASEQQTLALALQLAQAQTLIHDQATWFAQNAVAVLQQRHEHHHHRQRPTPYERQTSCLLPTATQKSKARGRGRPRTKSVA